MTAVTCPPAPIGLHSHCLGSLPYMGLGTLEPERHDEVRGHSFLAPKASDVVTTVALTPLWDLGVLSSHPCLSLPIYKVGKSSRPHPRVCL